MTATLPIGAADDQGGGGLLLVLAATGRDLSGDEAGRTAGLGRHDRRDLAIEDGLGALGGKLEIDVVLVGATVRATGGREGRPLDAVLDQFQADRVDDVLVHEILLMYGWGGSAHEKSAGGKD